MNQAMVSACPYRLEEVAETFMMDLLAEWLHNNSDWEMIKHVHRIGPWAVPLHGPLYTSFGKYTWTHIVHVCNLCRMA